MGSRRFIIVALIATPFVGLRESVAEESSGSLWQKGIDAAHKSDTVWAMSCFKQAFKQGMTDDSLYYLGAEIYLYKGVFDTALALNYSVKTSDAGDIRLLAIKQRYAIYMALGWQKEAKVIMDSLGGRSPSIIRRVLPECNLSVSGGPDYEIDAVDRHYPYPRQSDSTSRLQHGNGMASLQLGWHLSTFHLQEAQFGASLRYSGSRFSLNNSSAKNMDSTDAAAGAYVRYSVFADRFLLGYSFSQKRDFLNNKSSVHQYSLRAALLSDPLRGSISLGYQQQYSPDRRYYYFMFIGDRDIDNKNSIGLIASASVFFENEARESDKFYFLHVKNSTMYYDSAYTKPLQNSVNIDTTAYSTVYWDRTWPMSCLSVNPQIRFEHRFNQMASAGACIGYSMTRYLEKYLWYDLRYTEGKEPETNAPNPRTNLWESLARNGNDGRWYWVRYFPFNGATLDSLPVIFHEERRVDQAISLDLFFKYSIGRFGDLTLDAMAQRNFSTLMEAAPTDIQRWYATVTLSWDFSFKPEQ